MLPGPKPFLNDLMTLMSVKEAKTAWSKCKKKKNKKEKKGKKDWKSWNVPLVGATQEALLQLSCDSATWLFLWVARVGGTNTTGGVG